MKLILILMALTFNMAIGYAGENEFQGVRFQYNDGLSVKNFKNTSFRHTPIAPGTTIYASFFSREIPDSVVFQSTMTNVTFILCHLNNVTIPAGNIIKGIRAPIRYQVQNDLEDWRIDGSNNPVEPLLRDIFLELELSTQPADIPAQRMSEPLTLRTRRERGL